MKDTFLGGVTSLISNILPIKHEKVIKTSRDFIVLASDIWKFLMISQMQILFQKHGNPRIMMNACYYTLG
jgi:hypothetical protein